MIDLCEGAVSSMGRWLRVQDRETRIYSVIFVRRLFLDFQVHFSRPPCTQSRLTYATPRSKASTQKEGMSPSAQRRPATRARLRRLLQASKKRAFTQSETGEGRCDECDGKENWRETAFIFAHDLLPSLVCSDLTLHGDPTR